MENKEIKPTESELEILQILWDKQPATVRQINDELNKSKSTGYTTTLKIMQLMVEKHLLGRNLKGKTHTYYTLVEKEQTRQNLLESFLDKAFQGSAYSLVIQALGSDKATPDEIQKIKNYLSSLED